jgi:hypothetical protein
MYTQYDKRYLTQKEQLIKYDIDDRPNTNTNIVPIRCFRVTTQLLVLQVTDSWEDWTEIMVFCTILVPCDIPTEIMVFCTILVPCDIPTEIMVFCTILVPCDILTEIMVFYTILLPCDIPTTKRKKTEKYTDSFCLSLYSFERLEQSTILTKYNE